MVFRKAAGWGSLRNGVFLPYETSNFVAPSVGGGEPPPPPTPEELTASITPLAALTTIPRTVASDAAWTNGSNALVDDATAATSVYTSNQYGAGLSLTFANASIPTDARIDGVTVNIRMGADASGVALERLYLTDSANNAPINEPIYNTAITVPTTMTNVQIGGVGSMFGTSLMPAAFNSGKLGIALFLKRSSGTGTRTVSVQYVTLTVHYTTTLGQSATPKAAVASVMMRNDGNWTGNVAKLSRACWPGMGTPVAVMAYSATANRTNLPTSDTALASFAGIAGNVSFAVPSKQSGSFRTSNPTITAFDGTGMSTHTEQAIPSGQPGHGPQNYGFTIMGRNGQTMRANIPTFGTDFVDIQQTSAYGNEDFHVYLIGFFGVQAHLHQRQGFAAAEAPENVAAGFEPQIIISNATDQPNSAAHGAYGMLGLGGARKSGASWVNSTALQVFATQEYISGTPSVMPQSLNILVASDTLLSQQINTNEATSVRPDFNSEILQITGSSGSGYTLAPAVGSVRDENENGITLLALSGFDSTFLGWVDTPTATGSWTIPVGFRPDAVLGIGTLATAIGRTQDVSDLADAITVFMAGSMGRAVSQGYHVPNGHLAGTVMPAATFVSRNDFRVRSGPVSAPVDRVVASYTGVSATGPVLNVTTADATPRKMLVMAFK